ncbi:hypothetical protein [Pseudobdellovibrio sp. HCB154]|uniref:hypothetical protein n=1 Tax=Pseudobdellovibrio sp. HCB154 TaxID=3386277 RepID=UPI003916CE47
MYRPLILILTLLLNFSSVHAEVNSNDSVIDTTGLVLCDLNAIITQKCGVLNTSYLYDVQYGPRSSDYLQHYTAAAEETTLQLAPGWHEGNEITWQSAGLKPENIVKDKKIFGIVGTLDNTIYPDCDINGSASSTTAHNTNTCYAPSGEYYVYSSYWGGRDFECSFVQVDSTSYKLVNKYDGSKPKGACWINTTDTTTPDGFSIDGNALKTSGNPNFVIRNTASANTCPMSGPGVGLQTTSCTTPDRNDFNGFFYPAQVTRTINGVSKQISGSYGGRGKNCIYGSNNEPCWIDDADAYVENDTNCTEKSPDGTPGASGTALNAYSCKTKGDPKTIQINNGITSSTVGRFVYKLPQGGRNDNCAQGKVGLCFTTSDLKSTNEPDLDPDNIQKGLVIFGVRGTYEAPEIVYGSGAHRAPSSSTAVNRMTYKQNLTGESNRLEANPNQNSSQIYPTDYHPVPKISGDSEADVVKVNRGTWSNTQCGTIGTISARLANCASVFGSNATWKGTVKGNAGQTDWELITRKRDSVDTSKTYEVWRDTSTGLMWSSLVSTSLNWCKSTGSNGRKVFDGTDMVYDQLTSSEDDPSNYCDNATYQDQTTPTSACYIDLPENGDPNLFATTYNTSTTPGKAGLTPDLTAATGRVLWRVPSMYDYILANHHGLRFVLPDIGVNTDEEWTATTSASNRKNAWTFSGKTGSRQYKQRNNPAAVRCIGR